MSADQYVPIAAGIALWYVASFATLLLNKHLLGTVSVQPGTLATVQMVSAVVYGAMANVQTLAGFCRAIVKSGACEPGLEDETVATLRWQHAARQGLIKLGMLGVMRLATVLLSLVSLQHLAASFTETIKASAPIITALVAYLMLGEITPRRVFGSLIPMVVGLVLVSYNEVSFTILGFVAAVSTNTIECVQNVFSKRLLGEGYTAPQLQFYASVMALLLQMSVMIGGAVYSTDRFPHLSEERSFPTTGIAMLTEEAEQFSLPLQTFALLWVNGICSHLQSVAAYSVMSYLSPVTVSVVNTLKRGLLIWLSMYTFGNESSPNVIFGTSLLLLGVLFYNCIKQSAVTPVCKTSDETGIRCTCLIKV